MIITRIPTPMCTIFLAVTPDIFSIRFNLVEAQMVAKMYINATGISKRSRNVYSTCRFRFHMNNYFPSHVSNNVRGFYNQLTIFHMSKIPSIGIFWDYENVPVWANGARVPLAEKILEKIKPKGHIKIQNIYGKWDPYDPILRGLYALGFKPISVPMGIKNSSDLKLAVDSIASIYEDNLEVVVIISADKDFIPVINHIKSRGKEVIIIAQKSKSGDYISISPDEYIALEDLLNKSENRKLQRAEKAYVASLSKRYKSKSSSKPVKHSDNSATTRFPNPNEHYDPEIQLWIEILDIIEDIIRNSNDVNRFSLVNRVQERIQKKLQEELPKGQINDRIEFLLNIGLLVENRNLRYSLCSSYKIKRETFLKSFQIPKKQVSLLETF